MNDFFLSLQATFITIPNFLQESLIREGFDDISSFSALKPEQFQEFVIAVESQIKKLIKSADDKTNKIAAEAKVHFDRTQDSQDVDNYTLPLGFKLKLKSVHEYCSSQWNNQIKNANSIQSVNKSKKLIQPSNVNNKFSEKSLNRHEKHLKKVYNKLVKEEYKLQDDDMLVLETKQDSCTVVCPLCPKIFETFEFSRGQFNVFNFKTHIEKQHVEVNLLSHSNIADQSFESFVSLTDINHTNINNAGTSSSNNCTEETTLNNQPLSQPCFDTNIAGTSGSSANEKKKKVEKRKIINQDISPRRTRQKLNDTEMPEMIKMLVRNCRNIIDRNKGNRYDDEIKELSAFFYIRFGLKQYEFLSCNLNLPHVSSVRNHMAKSMTNLKESQLDFDGLKKFLQENNYELNVGLFEDGTKIVEKVEYDRESNSLKGLVAPFQNNGMPFANTYKAKTASKIMNAVNINNKASYVQVLMIQPNNSGGRPFLLGFYGTDNRFTSNDVLNRNEYVYKELKNRGIRLLCCGSDGDLRMLGAQKKAVDFGTITLFGPMEICGNVDSRYYGHQDMMHVLKRMKNILFSLSNPIIIGTFCATVNHLIIAVKCLPKNLHNLVPTDLDVTDKMDYKSIDKILDEKVHQALRLLENTESTIAYLQLMKKLKLALVDHNVDPYERIKNLCYAAHFIRIWKQWQVNNGIDKKHFISINCWEAIEIDLIMLLGLTLENLEHDISMLSSQTCEHLFRTVRSFTTTECTIVNMTAKVFESRVNHINYADKIMYKFKDQLNFPRLEGSAKHEKKPKIKLTYEQIIDAMKLGMIEANDACKKLGMSVDEITVLSLLKGSKFNEQSNEEDDQEILLQEIDEDTLHDLPYTLYDYEFTGEASNDGFLTTSKGSLEKVHKTQFLEMALQDRSKISTDIRFRFHTKSSLTFQPNASNEKEFWKDKTISKGDQILLWNMKRIYCGNVLDFKNLGEKTKSKSLYLKDFVEFTDTKKIGVLIDPIYEIQNDQKISIRNKFEYLDVDAYICHYKYDLNLNSESNIKLLKSFIKNQ
ncbi:hypothetical protein PVAND_001751 [Polypedilum vanderplanki]|uniref:Uncharacterized protein n=1 Tax=Polypedilum vanderplanki TaxID=319348 RepID=A0A9J6BQ73_POLVA|nr:hypothetical protein PVAND_001751 [Polypedilum vanderplanki]